MLNSSGYNFEFSHCRHVRQCYLANNISYVMCRRTCPTSTPISQLTSSGPLVTAINPKATEVRKAATAHSTYSFVRSLFQDHAG